jgi:ribose-phosphate pyrophosphokinase
MGLQVPVDHLYAWHELVQCFKQYDLGNGVVVLPDADNGEQVAVTRAYIGPDGRGGAKVRFDHIDLQSMR